MTTTKFAIIGAGAISQAYAQAFQSIAFKTYHEAEVIGVADIRKEAADSLAEVLNCQSFDSYAALSDACEPDAVLVCTPPASHPEICHHFIERGIHVLCEKPFAVSVERGNRVVEAAKEKGVTITMASKFRYVEDVIKAKQIVDSGILGEIVLLENAFTARVGMANRWNSDRTISGGGVLIDNGTHSFDIARYFLGPLAEVQVMEGKRSQGLSMSRRRFGSSCEARKVSSAISTFPGASTRSSTDISASTDLEEPLWSAGKRRSTTSRVRPNGWNSVAGTTRSARFATNYRNSPGRSRERRQLLINGTDAVASVEVVEAAYESLGENHWTAVKNGENSHDLTGQTIMTARIHPTALIEENVAIGDGSAIWDNVHIRHGATIGTDCIIGEKSYIAYDVIIGDRVKINAMVYICAAVTIEDGVMISAGTTFTNDRFPRATTPNLKELRPSEPDDETLPTLVKEGATIGAGCTIGNDLSIGRFAMVGMGSLVTKAVEDFHLVLGHPARPVGCVCRCGHPLVRFDEMDRFRDRG